MKEKILKRKLKKEIKKLREQSEFKVSQNDPSNSCVGRNMCCKDMTTSKILAAKFILKKSNRVECKCPKGSVRTTCEKTNKI